VLVKQNCSRDDFKVEASWNVMAHAQKPDFVFRRNGRVHLNLRGRRFSPLPATEVCASAFIVGSNAGYTIIRGSVQGTGYPLQSPVSPSPPLPASPCAITFQLESTAEEVGKQTEIHRSPIRSNAVNTDKRLPRTSFQTIASLNSFVNWKWTERGQYRRGSDGPSRLRYKINLTDIKLS